MKEPGLEGSFWPTERQKLLLLTAFGGDEAGAEAWRRLRPRLDLDRLEPGSFPLLPLVHRRLDGLGIEDSYMPRLAGIRRRTWYLNHVQLDGVTAALRALEGRGAEPVVVGGWQFPAHYLGGDFGLRPVDGLEALVRGGHAAAGSVDGGAVTLHERFAREFADPDLEDVWAATFLVQLGETSARVLGPTDELVRVCLAGARATVFPNILWLADALSVLETGIDWDRLVRQARRLRATLRLRDALVYLGRELSADVPAKTIRELEAAPVGRRERLAHREAGRTRPLLGPTPRIATRFLHVTSDRSLPAALVALPTFLRDELGLQRRSQVPIEVVRRAAARPTATPAGRTRVE
ncbi:MAG TPA: nucleotidyltransferase family protein [Gaiellaceae bacterium]